MSKTKVMTRSVNSFECSYITPNKVYEALHLKVLFDGRSIAAIEDDSGDLISVAVGFECAHTKSVWEIVNG